MTSAPTLNSLLDRSSTGRAIAGVLSDPKRFWVILLLIYLSLVPMVELFRGARSEPHGDVKLYQRTIETIWQGKMPYRDFEFEYPPYAIPFFVLPSLFKSAKGFQITFGVQILLIDLLVKGILIWMAVGTIRASMGESRKPTQWSISPSLTPYIPVLLFSLATAANHYFYLQRFDLIPAALTLGVLAAWWKERYFLAGLLLMAGIGCKLYPILFVPPLWIAAFRLNQARLFVFGLLIGALPLGVLGLFTPWWNFLAFHAGRGLQCECLYASIIWFLHHLGLCDASWTTTKAWTDITGPAASAVLPYAKCLFLGMTVFSVTFATWRAWRVQSALGSLEISRILLMILLPFVAFNTVFSPQYLVWLAVFAAFLYLGREKRHFFLIIIAAMITPIVYPSKYYSEGLYLAEAGMLALRNLILSMVSVLMFRHWK